MKSFIALLTLGLFAFAIADSLKSQFIEFQNKYQRTYKSDAEFHRRFKIFQQNLQRAAEYQKQNPLATFGVTKFMDLEPSEFSKLYKMPNFNGNNFRHNNASTESQVAPNTVNCDPKPEDFDWKSCGVVTAVRNQGQCGSCWAFSATETIESYCILAGAESQWYSVEQIVDCDTNGEDQGCNGGFPTGAYDYIQKAGGIETEKDYPYTAGEGEAGSCHFTKKDTVCTVTGYKSLKGEHGIYEQASKNGPVSVCVDASSWQFYSSGVLQTCGTDVDHCVQVTGYSRDHNPPYWHVRNSWGSDRGVNGYIWVESGKDLCDIGDYATVPTVQVIG